MSGYDRLDAAVRSGAARVVRTGHGWLVHGVRGDALIESELSQIGASWVEQRQAYHVGGLEARAAFGDLAVKTKAAQKALAARNALAAAKGSQVFDRYRAQQQRRITRELEAIYREALAEHAAEIAAIADIAGSGQLTPKEALDLAHRRGELSDVYDALADGLADAGAAAQAVMNGHLAESAQVATSIASWQIDTAIGMNVTRLLGNSTASLALTGATSYHGRYDLKAWQGVANKRKARATIRKAVARGLLTGENPAKVAQRIEGIYTGKEAGSPYRRALRIARTETGRVMNEAQLEQLERANELGIETKKKWIATIDGKTRRGHRKVDGEVRPVGEKFSNGLRRPGDGGASDSINCRCTLSPVVEGFEPKVTYAPGVVPMNAASYEEWRSGGR